MLSADFLAAFENLYPGCNVYGPYISKQNGRRTVVVKELGRKYSKQYAKVLLEIKLGRRLTKNDTVDHIDDDPCNDDPGNLQMLSLLANVAKSTQVVPDLMLQCSYCSCTFYRKPSVARSAIKKNGGKLYCSKSCSSKAVGNQYIAAKRKQEAFVPFV